MENSTRSARARSQRPVDVNDRDGAIGIDIVDDQRRTGIGVPCRVAPDSEKPPKPLGNSRRIREPIADILFAKHPAAFQPAGRRLRIGRGNARQQERGKNDPATQHGELVSAPTRRSFYGEIAPFSTAPLTSDTAAAICLGKPYLECAPSGGTTGAENVRRGAPSRYHPTIRVNCRDPRGASCILASFERIPVFGSPKSSGSIACQASSLACPLL